jgi:two-component system, chemotaxis family, response regulator Rcp1
LRFFKYLRYKPLGKVILQRERALNILLVDDNRGDEALIRLALKETDLGTRLEIAKTGKQAMSSLRKEGKYIHSVRPDVIILDLHLDGYNGQEVLRLIRDDLNLTTIPTLVFTSSDSPIQKAACLRLNADAYLVKPWDVEAYMTIIKDTERYWTSLLRDPSRVDVPFKRAS